MTTIAVVGAGPGLGAAVARRFAEGGFDVGLISRRLDHTRRLADDLVAEGHAARAYAADVREPDTLRGALRQVAADLGPIEVLTYSPIPQPEFLRPVLETQPEDITAAVEFSVLGPVAAVGQVLEGMRSLGHGTILFINGGSAVRPNSRVAGTSIAFAAESAYGQMLHEALGADALHVAQLVIPGPITRGHPTHDPGVLADRLWDMHVNRGEFRVYAEAMPDS